MKDKNDAPINYGFDATRNHRHIGQGIDVALRWLIFSDVSFYANYAVFLPLHAMGRAYYLPGDALGNAIYRDARKRHFIMAGMNISF